MVRFWGFSDLRDLMNSFVHGNPRPPDAANPEGMERVTKSLQGVVTFWVETATKISITSISVTLS